MASKRKLLIGTLMLLSVTPEISYAAPQNFRELVEFTVSGLINPLIFLAGSVAFLAFFWGVALYIFKSGDEDSKEYGRNIMLYGIIALFVMVSVWGLIQVIKNTFFEGAPQPSNSLGDPAFTDDPNFDPTDPRFPPRI